MSLTIQRWLIDNGPDFATLLARYGIKVRRHGEHSNLVLFKYDQIASPFAETIVRECRGIVLDESDGWRVVSRAFDKFFNHGEGHAAPIEWASARVQEKVDGSLCVLYWYAGQWHVATTGTPDAGGDVHGFGLTFRDYFWSTFDAQTNELPSGDCGVCFYFELTGPHNRIVVPHASASVTLLGARDLRTQRELTAREAASLYLPGVKVVGEYPLGSFDDIAASFASISPLTQEGYVVVDRHFNRVKVKHPGYVALHHAKDGMTRKAFVEIARSGETSEVVTAFPEFAPLLAEAKARVDALIVEVEADYERLRHIPEQKAFAMSAMKTRCSSALFSVRATKAESVRTFFRDCRIQLVMDLIGGDWGADEPIAPEAA